MSRKIIQIMPAPKGFSAVYKINGRFTPCQITCLALTENDDGIRSVEGLDGDGGYFEFCEDIENFSHYEAIT